MGKYTIVGIIALAIIVRITVFSVLLSVHDPAVFEMGDTIGYMRIADNVIAGHGFSMATSSPYVADGMRTPVLPYLFAMTKGVTGSAIPYIVFQIGLSAATIYLTFRIALIVTGRENLALLATAFSAFEPYSVFINMSLLTETVFATLLLAGIYAACVYIKRQDVRALAIASALFALAALTRPIAQFLPFVLIVLVLFRSPVRHYGKHGAIVLASFVLVLSPWLIRNYELFGTASISSGGYQNVYSDLGATIISYRDGIEWYVAKNQLNIDFATRHNIPLEDLQQDPKWNSVFLREGITIMVSNPVSTITAFTSVAFAFFTNDIWAYYPQRWGWMESFTYGFSPTHILLSEGPIAAFTRVVDATGGGLFLPVVGRLFWLGISILFFVGSLGMYLRGGEKRMYAVFFFTITMYMVALALSAGAGVNGRYRYPINAILYVPALYAARGILRRGMVLLRRIDAA